MLTFKLGPATVSITGKPTITEIPADPEKLYSVQSKIGKILMISHELHIDLDLCIEEAFALDLLCTLQKRLPQPISDT